MKKCTGVVLYERNKKAQYIVSNVTILTRAGGVIQLKANKNTFETIHDATNFILHLMKKNNFTCNYTSISENAGVYDVLFIDKQNNTMQKELYCNK